MTTDQANGSDKDFDVDLADAFGASDVASDQVLTLYIPNKDREDQEFGTQRRWVTEAAELLAGIGGGVTIMPPVEGGWFDAENDRTIWERPVVVYTYVKPGPFLERLPDLRTFLHRLGRETNQGEVVVEFDNTFYRITSFDPAKEG